jgi:hypothetical protein
MVPERIRTAPREAQTCRVKGKGCGVLAAIAIGFALPLCGIVGGALSGSMEPFLWSLTSVVLIGFIGIAWSGLRYDLLRVNGVSTSGKIVSVSRIDLGPLDFDVLTFYEVHYSYLDQDGVEHWGTSRPTRSIPLVSEPHVVRYDPSNPSRSLWIN